MASHPRGLCHSCPASCCSCLCEITLPPSQPSPELVSPFPRSCVPGTRVLPMTAVSPALTVGRSLLAVEPSNPSNSPQRRVSGHSPTFFKSFASQLIIFISIPTPTKILGDVTISGDSRWPSPYSGLSFLTSSIPEIFTSTPCSQVPPRPHLKLHHGPVHHPFGLSFSKLSFCSIS